MVVLVRRRVRETSWCVRELGIRGGAVAEQLEDRCFKYRTRISFRDTLCIWPVEKSRNMANEMEITGEIARKEARGREIEGKMESNRWMGNNLLVRCVRR